MAICLTPEVGLPLPDANTTPEEELGFREKAHVLCKTVITTYGGEEYVPIEPGDSRDAAHMFATSHIPTRPAPRPGSILKLEAMLEEYDHQVVESAAQVRTYVTNKLIEETDHPDAKIRIKALELLGKISDVGLFAEKLEVSIKERRTEEIDAMLSEKLARLQSKLLANRVQDVEDVVLTPKPIAELDVDDFLENPGSAP